MDATSCLGKCVGRVCGFCDELKGMSSMSWPDDLGCCNGLAGAMNVISPANISTSCYDSQRYVLRRLRGRDMGFLGSEVQRVCQQT